MMSRYFVDERDGCVAVIDEKQIDPEYRGLHSDTFGVVKYWHGTPNVQPCPTCGHMRFMGWTANSSQVAEARKLADELNHKEAELAGGQHDSL